MRILALIVLLTAGSALTGFSTDANAIWADKCAKCHGENGNGDTKFGKKLKVKDFTQADIQAALTDDEAFKAIKEGIKDKNGKNRMKPAEGLSDQDIKAMVQYVRSLKK